MEETRNEVSTTLKKHPLSTSLQDTIGSLKRSFGSESDLSVREFEQDGVPKAAILCIESLIDKKLADEFVVREINRQLPELTALSGLRISTHSAIPVHTEEEVSDKLLTGHTVILWEGESYGLAAGTEGGTRRSVTEPTSESVVRGPQDAFNESLQTNIGLLRRRIASPKLRVEICMLGELSRTPVAIVYLKGTARDGVIREVRERLKRIRSDGISGDLFLEEILEHPGGGYTPFPTVFNTERPDRLAAGIMEGRVGILTEGTPFSLMVPVTISSFLISNEDYYQRFDIASLVRIMRIFAFLISFTLPGFYVSVLTYHQEMLPTPLLISLTGQREGVPFGIAIELTAMELIFELLREAGVRLPKTIGSAVSIVGGLVLGTAAVEASLVGPGTVISVSVTAISSFCIPSYNLVITSRILRFGLLFLSAIFGAYGLFFGLIFISIHLNTLRSFGVPYLASLTPFHGTDWKDLFVRLPLWRHKWRPHEIAGTQNRKRR